MNKRNFLLSIVFLLAGCHAAEVTMYGNKYYTPTSSVEILSDLSQVKREYVEIGYVEAKGGITVSKQELLEDMKQKAKQLGANALVKVEFYDRERYDNKIGSYSKPAAKAIMIRYK